MWHKEALWQPSSGQNNWLDRAVTSLVVDCVLEASGEVMDEVDSLKDKMRRKRQGGQNMKEGEVRLGGELHADQLVLQIKVVLGVGDTPPVLFNCLNM